MEGAEALTRLGGLATSAQLLGAAGRVAVEAAIADGTVERATRGRYVLPGVSRQRRVAAHRARGPGAARVRRVAELADARAANPFGSALRALTREVPDLACETHARDCVRYHALVVAGWTVLRFTWEHVVGSWAYVLAVLRDVVAAAA